LTLVHSLELVAAERDWPGEMAFPALLRAARTTYGSAIRAALDEAGCDDVPRNGSYVIGAIARTGAPLGQVIKELGVSKQAAGQLVDALVTRGYLDRSVDPEDRRRLTITLTERGRAAAGVIRSAVERVDADLVGRVGPEFVAHTRATLAALIESSQAATGHDRG
jgi:DNA-binding MarR family transcriptional regulator